MAISYDKLWKVLIDNKLNKTQFRKATDFVRVQFPALGQIFGKEDEV